MKAIIRSIILAVIGSLAFVSLAEAQVTVTGVISDSNRLVLPYAGVVNLTTGKRAFSDQGGFYKIAAGLNDKIVITFVGYLPDTIVATQSSGTQTINVILEPESRFLREVEVTTQYTPYQLDSIARREQYGYLLNLPNKPLAGGNTPEGAGVVFSPITRFSKKERQKRQFKENYEKMEREKYIDSRFTPVLVSRVTGLNGDSLLMFMKDNYPDYGTMRAIGNNDLLYWITDRYKAWIKK